jgi:hypothetical protein
MKKILFTVLALLMSVPSYAADAKLTAGTADTAPIATDIVYFVKDPGGTPLSRKLTIGNLTKGLTIANFPGSANVVSLLGAADYAAFKVLLLPGTAYKLMAYTATNVPSELAAVGATGELLVGVTGAIPKWLAAGASGKIAIAKGAADIEWTPYTMPSTVPTVGKGLISDGTNLIASTSNLCVPTEIDGHAAASPTAVQLASCNATSIHNYNQAAADVNITLPAAAANLGFLATVSTAQAANYWRFTSAGTDMYLNGSATAKQYVQYATPVAGYYFSCFTANRGNTYSWYCADGVGVLTTN